MQFTFRSAAVPALVAAGLAVALAGPRAQSPAPAADPVAALKEKVAAATRMLAREDVLTSSGHVSARIPGTNKVIIGANDRSRETLRPDQLVTVDLDGTKLEGTEDAPAETEIHLGVYRARPDVASVVHSHPVHSVVFSMTGKPILPVSVHGAIFADGVPVFPHVGHVNTRELGDELAKTLGKRRAALMKMHGAVIVGTSVEEAFVAAIQLEENAEKQLWAEATGTVTPMSPGEVERCIKQSFGARSIAKRWEYYQERERERVAALRPGTR